MGLIEMALKWENGVGAFLDSGQCFVLRGLNFFTFFQPEKYDFDT
jgi:hypothetical protein